MPLLLLSLTLSSLVSAAPVERPVKSGESFDSIALQTYGSRHYGGLLAIFNGAKQGARPPKSVKLPTLEEGLATVGFPNEIQGVAQLVGSAAARLSGIGVDLKPLRPKKPGQTVTLSSPVLIRLRTVQADLNQAASALELTAEKWKPPTVAIDKLRKAANALDDVAAGKLDPKGAELDAVHAQIAQALEELVRWSRAGFH